MREPTTIQGHDSPRRSGSTVLATACPCSSCIHHCALFQEHPNTALTVSSTYPVTAMRQQSPHHNRIRHLQPRRRSARPLHAQTRTPPIANNTRCCRRVARNSNFRARWRLRHITPFSPRRILHCVHSTVARPSHSRHVAFAPESHRACSPLPVLIAVSCCAVNVCVGWDSQCQECQCNCE